MSSTPASSLSNPHADWLNFRGTWMTNVLLTVALGVLFSCVPGMTREMIWTLTNLTYNIVWIRCCDHGVLINRLGGIVCILFLSLDMWNAL